MECYRGWDWNFYYDVIYYIKYIYIYKVFKECEIILEDHLGVIVQ